MKKTIIFTDLDGTLLDHSNYSFADAQPALQRVAASATPLILCSSKTRRELEHYRRLLGSPHPFISENGGGIFIPRGYFPFAVDAEPADEYQLIRLGTPYAEIRKQFTRLREQHHAKVRGFADMSAAEVAALTGLAEKGAIAAQQREFDEPFLFDGELDGVFLNAIEAAGLRWTQGRLFHIMGSHDKGRAVNMLIALYRRQFGETRSIALGDGLNDLAMLVEADQPVLVRRADGSFDTRIAMAGLLKTRLPGPAGWNESVLDLLADEPAAGSPIHRQELAGIFDAALAAVDPYKAVLNAVRIEHERLLVAGETYDLADFERIIVVGAGKATARMALALETLLGNKIATGLIVVKDGHTAPLTIIDQVEAAHPVPNQAGIAGTQRILDMAQASDEKALVIGLISGGASALLIAPVEGVTLQDKQETTRLLLNAGANIFELNAVRKHLSRVKGGRLAEAAFPARLVTLIVSDVIGDPLDVIASGPTSPDNSTFAEAWAVIEKFGLREILPPRVADYLQRGIAGQVEETVKENDPCLTRTRNVIVAGINLALAAAQRRSAQLGYSARVISDSLEGEAGDAARLLAQTARDELAGMKPDQLRCLLYGGETTVTVHGNGKGGRNQQLALVFGLEVDGLPGVAMLSAGTDGTDGPTDAAGAMVDGETIARANRLGIDPQHYLDNNDSYAFFGRLDRESGTICHFKSGPTGTNVMDIQIVLLDTTRTNYKAGKAHTQVD
ncbi:MAG: HAD-IIB family hydrolase [Gallionella sp.]